MQSGSSQASLEDSIKLSFSFWMVGQSLCITRKTLTTLSLYCAFRNLDRFRTHKIEGTCLSITNCNVLNLWHNDRFLHHVKQHHVQNEQLDFSDFGLVSSVFFIWPLFVSVSPSVLLHQSHTSSYRVKPPRHPFSVNLVPFQNIARVHPLRCSDLANSFFLVSLDWFFAHALLDTSLSLSWWSFMCSSKLTRAAVTLSLCLLTLPSHGVAFPQIFVFLARSSLDLRHRPFDPLGSASPPQVAQSFCQPFATSRVKRVNIKRKKTEREKLKEMMTSLHKRMSRGLSVSLNHKKHTIAAKPCLNI